MATRKEREKDKRVRKRTDAREWADKQGGFESKSIKLPDKVSFFSTKKTGIYSIDVIPYVVGVGNPQADEGFEHFERTYYVHRNMGLDSKSSYVCLAQTFGKKCPVCEWIKKEGRTADEDTIKGLKPQMRHLWNVINLEDPSKGIQVWDTAHWKSFGEMLTNKIKAVPDYKYFSELTSKEGGMTLQISVEEQSMGNNKFNGVINIEMLRRKKDYDEDILDKAVCLDDCIIEMNYNDLKKIFLQEADDEEPPRRSAKAKEPDEDEEDEEDDVEGEETKALSKNGRSAIRRGREEPEDDEDDDEDEDEDDDDNKEEDEEEDEEESPKPRRRVVQPAARKVDKVEEEDESEEEEEDDEPEEPKRRGRPARR